MPRQLSLGMCLATLLAGSGCAIHTPFEVVRYWGDYNTEGQLNAQVESFDHLPPKPARVKLMRWGYNVGPSAPSGTGTMGIGTGIWAERLYKVTHFWHYIPGCEPGALDDNYYEDEEEEFGPMPPTVSLPNPPPAPPAEDFDLDESKPTLPSPPLPAEAAAFRTVGYERRQTAPQRTSTPPPRATPWMFLPSTQPPPNSSRGSR